MLPPKSPGHRPPNASAPSGATATRPSIGRSGDRRPTSIALSGRSTVPVMRCAVEPPHVAAARERLVQERGAGIGHERAEAAALASRPPCRGSGAPSGSRPPACRPARRPRSRSAPPRPATSRPAFSYHSPQSVSLSTTSPGLTVSTGSRTAKVGWPTLGTQAVGLGARPDRSRAECRWRRAPASRRAAVRGHGRRLDHGHVDLPESTEPVVRRPPRTGADTGRTPMKPTPDPSRRPRERAFGALLAARRRRRRSDPCASSSSARTRTTATWTRAAPPRCGRPRGTRSSSSRSRTATPATSRRAAARSRSAGAPEAQEAGRRLGIAEYEVLDNHDGELEPTLAVRQQVIRRIRAVAGRRRDRAAARTTTTPTTATPASWCRTRPTWSWCRTSCPTRRRCGRTPSSSTPTTTSSGRTRSGPTWRSSIDAVIDKKIDALDAHVSQVYEWLPWVDGGARQRAEGAGRAARLAAPAAQRPADRRRRARGAAQVVRREGRRR